jgi:biopolymer transport protein ExbD
MKLPRLGGDGGIEVDLPITPMLDLAFQVLLFFVATYHPSQLEGQMELNLPDTAQTQAATPEEADPTKSSQGDPELPAEITVVLKTQVGSSAGKISRISIQERQGTKDVDNGEELRKYLVEARKGLANQKDIKIQADGTLKYGHVMEIMDMCSRAGFTNVGFGPPADVAGPNP